MNPTNTKDLNDPLRLFPARILDKVQEGSEWRYAWASMLPSTTDGAYPADPLDPSSGMIAPWYGTTTNNYALALNNAEVDVDSEVWMRLRGMVMGQHVYEFGPPLGTQNTVSGGPRGGCGLAVLKPTDCVKFTNSFDGSTHYGTNTGAGVWTSDDDIDYPGGSGPAVLTYASGAVSLTVDGIAMLPCGNGCWSGGPLTGHADDAEVEPCDGETFTVCVSCSCCVIEGWAGPGWYCVGETCEPLELLEEDKCDDIVICSGPYEDESTATAACSCTAAVTDLGTTELLATFSNPTGTGTCFPATKVSNNTSAFWTWTGPFGTCNGGSDTLQLLCSGGEWVLLMTDSISGPVGPPFETYTVVSFTPDPFEVVIDIVKTDVAGFIQTGAWSIRMTITDNSP